MKLFAAAVCALLIAVGVGMLLLPAGLITAGVEGLCWLYVATYLDARAEADG